MADDPMRGYLDARTTFNDSERRVMRIVESVRELAKALDDPWSVRVSGGVVVQSMETLRGPSIDASDWPSLEELAEALAAWHIDYGKMISAYQQVKGPDRQSLQEPPRYKR